MDKKETIEKFDNITTGLQRLMEQTQVKASLLKLEAKDAWEDVGKVFFNIQSFLKKDWNQTQTDLDEAQLHMHLAMMEAREEWQEFKNEISEGVKKLNAGEKFDHAVLQAHLAKMEMKDRFKEKRKNWTENYDEVVKPHLKKSMEEMQSEMDTMAKSLVD